ncbi:PTS sugar transporter subunit IIA [Calycomorphotria hydatis]|uniref:PTS system fructose-specific EIIABC component n=1 Tax=Calycomorphotria hydatis TaxID=2528027 RepID=A0A517T7P4_9PLAN|nr:PTS sugar transporter subunit IIA [Calycomorphotria hydatis]QDT64395.1 PTS system fructose-specific EIIABC component [Calycomorphotria hydatis]
MQQELLSLEDLAQRLGRDKRELEKLASRGRIPGRKRNDAWVFSQREITQWLEQELREYSDAQLQNVEVSNRTAELTFECPITSLLTLETIEVPLEGRTKRSVLETLMEVAGRTYQIWEPAKLLSAVHEREDVLSTGFAGGVAIPHPRNSMPDAMGESVIAYGRTPKGIPFGAPDGQLTDLFFLVLCRDSRSHLQVLARLARMLQLPEFLDELRAAEDSTTSLEVIRAAEESIQAL